MTRRVFKVRDAEVGPAEYFAARKRDRVQFGAAHEVVDVLGNRTLLDPEKALDANEWKAPT